MPEDVRVVVYGVGPIGGLITKVALKKRGLEVVGAIDIDPKKVDKDLAEVVGLGKAIGVKVSSDAEKVLSEVKPDVVLHATRTYLDQVYPELVKCINAGASVISTCETLAYPWYRYPDLAVLIDGMAKRRDVTIVGTGISPGYRFDSLLAFLSTVCAEVTRIKATLCLDAAKRRYSFQKKIGLGMTPKEFKEKMVRGEITAHVGYAESVLLLASMLGVRLDKVEEGQEPTIAKEHMKTQYFDIKRGHVSGIKGYGRGYIGSKEFILVELIAEVDAKGYEDVDIEGEPTVHWRNEPEIPGDIATAAIVVNMIPRVLEAPSGLLTMKDLVLPSATMGDFKTSRRKVC